MAFQYQERKYRERARKKKVTPKIDESRLSGPINTYKLPQEEIEKIFKDVKPEKHSTFIKSWPRGRKDEEEENGLDPAWLFDRDINELNEEDE